MDEAISTQSTVRGVGLFAGADGGRVYDYQFAPLLDQHFDVESIAGSARDVTEAQRAEIELREADRRKEDFIALLAHELRNPLAPVINGLQIIKLAHDDPATLAEVRDLMDRQLTHLVRLIDDLLDVSRITRYKLQLQRERIALSDVISDAVEALRPAMEARGHELKLALPSTEVALHADRARLSQVLFNLLSNSIEFTARGGEISLTASVSDGQLELVVKDTGKGMPEGDLTRIFDMFAQVERGDGSHHGGLGVGLALVKGLVRLHGGTVHAESPGVGKGSSFTMKLPTLTDAQDTAVLTQAATWEPPKASTRRILIADDNQDLLASTARMLRLLGHEVFTASDGVEAVEAAERYYPDVILMDIGMPRLDGLDATRRIRQTGWGKEIAVVALTGWGQEKDRRASERAGCDAHLVKPVRLSALDRLLSTLTSRPLH